MTTQSQSLHLVQITDSHLFKTDEGKLLGMDTDHSLGCVLDLIRAEHPEFDRFLCTGDLSQDGSIEAYQRLKSTLSQFNVPQHWLAGNHDDQANMAEVTQSTDMLKPIIDLGDWVVVMLDSQVPGSVFGNLADDQFVLLEQAISEFHDRHILISFHHQPITIGAEWLDNIGIKNGDKLVEFAEQHSQVKALLWGHIHQETDFEKNGVRYLSTPSTCVQFTPQSEDFDVDSLAPGYRWLTLNPDGSIDTAVSRVEGIEFEIDYSIKGY